MAESPKITFPDKMRFLFEPQRYKVAYGGRGSSKSWSFARALLLQGVEKPLRVLCTRETQESMKQSVHWLLSYQIRLLGLQAFYRVLKDTIVGRNGTEFVFAGIRQHVHDLKSFEGCDICWVEEAQFVSDNSWEVLIPTIRKDGSEIWICFNPVLATDATYKRFVIQPPTNCIPQFVNWYDNPWFTGTLVEEKDELKARDPVAYEHVYEGVCRQAAPGAVYRTELIEAEKAGRIARVPYDPAHQVHTFWDLGFGDNTAIWFAQTIAFEFRLIDFISGCQQSLAYYLRALQERKYVYGKHYLPFDAQSHSLASARTVQEQVNEIYPGKVEIAPKVAIVDGIAAARSIFSRCWFDAERCADGIQALRHYRYEVDLRYPSPSGVLAFKREPIHDWASHAADAFRYMALAITEPKRRQEVEKRVQYYYPGQQQQSWLA